MGIFTNKSIGYHVDTLKQRNFLKKNLKIKITQSNKVVVDASTSNQLLSPFLAQTSATLSDNKELFQLIKDNKGYIAGGSISCLFSNRKINDFDIFFRNKEDHINFVNSISIPSDVATSSAVTYTLDNENTTYGPKSLINGVKIQAVSKQFGSPEEIFNTFDFRCCMGAYCPNKDDFIFDSMFFTDNINRELTYNTNRETEIETLIRVFKYIDYGYTISFSQLLKIIFSINLQDISTWGEFIGKYLISTRENIGVLKYIKKNAILKKDLKFSVNELISFIDEFYSEESELNESGPLRF